MDLRVTGLASALVAVLLLSPLAYPSTEPPAQSLDAIARRTFPAISLAPNSGWAGSGVVVHGGTPAQQRRFQLALQRFDDAGLSLPPLEVQLSSDKEECGGHHGLFSRRRTPWTVTICSDMEAAYEHELAHAWIAAALTDADKQRFMALRGYDVWSDQSVAWNERGTEGAAWIIQQGLSGAPLPPVLSEDQLSRLAAFEMLTGVPDTRLAVWRTTHGNGSDPF